MSLRGVTEREGGVGCVGHGGEGNKVDNKWITCG